ncbi:Tyrosine recombinase XerC [subsurface metagenome]
MKNLKMAADDYIKLRRALGFKLTDTHYFLKNFTSFMEREHAPYITTELALRWAKQPQNTLPAWWSKRLSAIRSFARHMKTMDPRHEVPPNGILPNKYQRRTPYIYSNEEVLALLQACEWLPRGNGLLRYTYYTVFGLLAVTGMRIGEITALQRKDVDLTQGILTIRDTKFQKSRAIPVHESTVHVLGVYAHLRDQIFPDCKVSNFFLTDFGTGPSHLAIRSIRHAFIQLSRKIGLRKPTDSNGPRVHDLRHRFAVNTIIRWYRQGVNVDHHIPILSTYLGHTKPSDTYWYLSSVPELIGLTATRLEKYIGGSDEN